MIMRARKNRRRGRKRQEKIYLSVPQKLPISSTRCFRSVVIASSPFPFTGRATVT